MCAEVCERWVGSCIRARRAYGSFKVSDNAKVLPYVGDHVIVVGDLKGDTLSVKTIRRSSKDVKKN
jgi:hypothetical protein